MPDVSKIRFCAICTLQVSARGLLIVRSLANLSPFSSFPPDVALMECSDFMQQLRSFKPQSLGSIVARRKSSTTLIFPLPPQACSGKRKQSKSPNYWRKSFRSLFLSSSSAHGKLSPDKLRLIFHAHFFLRLFYQLNIIFAGAFRIRDKFDTISARFEEPKATNKQQSASRSLNI